MPPPPFRRITRKHATSRCYHLPSIPNLERFHSELTSRPPISFRIDLPGVRKEQVKVDLENGKVLKITGEMCVEKEDRVNRRHLIEHGGRRFVGSILLPEDSKPHEVEACMEDGVLNIRVPRIEMKNGTANIAIR